MAPLFELTSLESFLQDIYKKSPGKFEEPVTVGMLQFAWDIFIDEKKRVSVTFC